MANRKHAAHKPPTATDKASAPEPASQATAAGAQTDIIGLQRQAGNRAVSELLQSSGPGQSLPAATRATMEERLGHDFGDVRVHTGPQAAQAAQGVDAAAFTTGQDIVFDAGTYAPGTLAGDQLLAHELSHVVQQRQASAVTEGISAPGDAAEQSAEAAARGEIQHIATGGSVPAVQRQPAPQTQPAHATRAQAQTALADFFRRVVVAQGGTDRLRGTAQVWNGIHDLFSGDMMRSGSVDVWLTRPDPGETAATPGSHRSSFEQFEHNIEASVIPSTPNGLAAEVVRFLPETIDPALIARLNGRRAVQEPLSLPRRVAGVISSSAPGGPEDTNEPRQPTSSERAEQFAGDLRRAQGLPDPTTIGPVPIDVTRLLRIGAGLPGAIRTPRTTAPIEARSYPAVEQAIADIERSQANALIPPGARGTPQADNYANVGEFARHVARELDIAQQRRNTQLTIELGANYAAVPDRGTIYQAARDIVYRIRDALPHHASEVSQIFLSINGRSSFGFPLRPSTP